MGAGVQRGPRGEGTRQAILDAAEQLFAEHGLDGVSHRQISSAAGQGNNAAVGYHFGTTADLVAAIVERHATPVEEVRARMVERVTGSTEIRDWVECLFRPTAEHLESLGPPTWWARLSAQLAADPRRHALHLQYAPGSDALARTVAGFRACLPDLPDAVREERAAMARLLAVHVFADRETALAEDRPTPRGSWSETADGVVDAMVGLWTAPVTRPSGAGAAQT